MRFIYASGDHLVYDHPIHCPFGQYSIVKSKPDACRNERSDKKVWNVFKEIGHKDAFCLKVGFSFGVDCFWLKLGF